MNTKHIEDALLEVDAVLSKITDLENEAELIQTDLNETAAKELATFDDKNLSNDEKAKRLIENRTYGEVVKDGLNKAKAELYAAEDAAIQAGISVHFSLGGFRDAIRATALEKAKAALNDLLFLEKGEDMHFAQRARTVHALDRIEILSFVGNNSPNSLLNLPKLRRVFNVLKALA
jgi:hypothetical protein